MNSCHCVNMAPVQLEFVGASLSYGHMSSSYNFRNFVIKNSLYIEDKYCKY